MGRQKMSLKYKYGRAEATGRKRHRRREQKPQVRPKKTPV
jgi:hypothetical protein